MKNLLKNVAIGASLLFGLSVQAQFSGPSSVSTVPTGITRNAIVNVEITNPTATTAEIRSCLGVGCDPSSSTATVTPATVTTGVITASLPAQPGGQGQDVEWVAVINGGAETSAVQTYHVANPGPPTNLIATTSGADSTTTPSSITFTYDGDGLNYSLTGRGAGSIQIRYCDPTNMASTCTFANVGGGNNDGSITSNAGNSIVTDNGDGTFEVTVTDVIPAFPDGSVVIWAARLFVPGAVRTTSSQYTTQVGGDVLGLNDINKEDVSSQIFPSPAIDVLNISANLNTKTYQVIDMSGATVVNKKADGSIDVSNLQSGIYFLITDAGTAKFVKQ